MSMSHTGVGFDDGDGVLLDDDGDSSPLSLLICLCFSARCIGSFGGLPRGRTSFGAFGFFGRPGPFFGASFGSFGILITIL